MRNPLISIVTVSYNAVDTIEETILSVINQTYPNIEYIIIDGGSTDGTVDVIKKYSEKLAYWVSEPDKGVYDGMNKAILVAKGKWINFMNSGDVFYNSTVLSDIFDREEVYNDNIHVLYGAVELIFKFGRVKKTPNILNQIEKSMVFSHQSCLVLTSIMKKNKFDTTYKIVADYDLFLKLYKQNFIFFELPLIVASYDNISGISSSPTLKFYNLHQRELNRLHAKREFFIVKIIFSFFYLVKGFLKRIMPVFLRERLQKLFFNLQWK